MQKSKAMREMQGRFRQQPCTKEICQRGYLQLIIGGCNAVNLSKKGQSNYCTYIWRGLERTVYPLIHWYIPG